MQLEEVAKALKELGHPTRLFIFKHLVKAGEQGLPVGDLQKQLAIPASTLSHHIAALVSRLAWSSRTGRAVPCCASLNTKCWKRSLRFFREECCVNSNCT